MTIVGGHEDQVSTAVAAKVLQAMQGVVGEKILAKSCAQIMGCLGVL